VTRNRAPAAALIALALVTTFATGRVAPARADGDPASDFLLSGPVFYPYQPPTSPALAKTLDGMLGALKATGLNLKVAIIADPTDLGAVTNVWNRPQIYADFLDREISYNTGQPLLVVMPAGFGVANAGRTDALHGMAVDTDHSPNGLARSAILAVIRLARSNGKTIPTPAIPAETASTRSSGTPALILFGAPVMLVALAALIAGHKRRRTPDHAGDE
jgi:hypothetical protein